MARRNRIWYKRLEPQQLLSLIIGVLTAAVSFTYFIYSGKYDMQKARTELEVQKFEIQLLELKRELRRTTDSINYLKDRPIPHSIDSVQIVFDTVAANPNISTENLTEELKKIKREIDKKISLVSQQFESSKFDSLSILSERLKIIEVYVLENPEKALSIPLIENNIEQLKRDQAALQLRMKEDLDRVYSQNQWFIGLMFTLALAVIGLAIGNFLPSKKRSTKQEEQNENKADE